MKRYLLLLLFLLVGCAKQPLTVPQPGAVQGGISRTQSTLTTAQQQQLEIQRKNTKAQEDLARVDAKDKFLEGYRKWKSQHP